MTETSHYMRQTLHLTYTDNTSTIRLIIPYKHLYAQNLSHHIRISYVEKLFIILYTHLYSQNNSDDVRFRKIRCLRCHRGPSACSRWRCQGTH